MAKIRKFAGNRPLEEIKQAVIDAGDTWQEEKFREGSDYVSFGFMGKWIVYNTFNGNFIVNVDGEMITGESKLDGVEWFDKLLDFLYLPLPKKARRKA